MLLRSRVSSGQHSAVIFSALSHSRSGVTPGALQTMDVLIALLKPKQEGSRCSLQQHEPSLSPSSFQSAYGDSDSSSAATELDATIKQATVQVGRFENRLSIQDTTLSIFVTLGVCSVQFGGSKSGTESVL